MANKELIDYSDFEKVEMRVGRIIEVQDFPEARKPAYKLKIDFGEFGVKRSSAQITQLYSKDDLLGKLVIAVVNLKPKRIAGYLSEVLVLGVLTDDGAVALLTPDREVPLGRRVF
ncbi:MAG: tRNA-binding protein [Candidatus Hydrothermota bacterium]|nr:MAG: tRNA-binding protein [Candidatus Hydrothermae bacterium]